MTGNDFYDHFCVSNVHSLLQKIFDPKKDRHVSRRLIAKF